MKQIEVKLEAIAQAVQLNKTNVNLAGTSTPKDVNGVIADAKVIYDFLIEGLDLDDAKPIVDPVSSPPSEIVSPVPDTASQS